MLVKARTKSFSSICKIMMLLSLFTQTAINSYAIDTTSTEYLRDNFGNESFLYDYLNGDKLKVVKDDSNIIVKRMSGDIDVWNVKNITSDNLHFHSIFNVKEMGFVIINNYCDFILPNESDSLNRIQSHQCKSTNMYNLVAYNSNGDMLLSEDTSDLSHEFFDNFIEDVFMTKIDSFDESLDSLSQEGLHELSLELISVAEKTLSLTDIEKANRAISKIEDETLKETLVKRLNIISNESIDKELSAPNEEEAASVDIDALSTSSEISLSVDTNNITFDYLNVSEDTILHKAITLDVTSTLPYDINMHIEGNIVSNTNSTNLNNNIFSVKESNSTNFLTFDDSGVLTVISSATGGVANSYGIDVKLNTSSNIIRDVYRAVFKLEAITK